MGGQRQCRSSQPSVSKNPEKPFPVGTIGTLDWIGMRTWHALVCSRDADRHNRLWMESLSKTVLVDWLYRLRLDAPCIFARIRAAVASAFRNVLEFASQACIHCSRGLGTIWESCRRYGGVCAYIIDGHICGFRNDSRRCGPHPPLGLDPPPHSAGTRLILSCILNPAFIRLFARSR